MQLFITFYPDTMNFTWKRLYASIPATIDRQTTSRPSTHLNEYKDSYDSESRSRKYESPRTGTERTRY